MHSEDFPFEVLIDDELLCSLAPGYNNTKNEERLLGITNDYEDTQWRISFFCDILLDYLTLSALSNEERDKCQKHPRTMIARAIKRLRAYNNDTTQKNTGEIAEIMLYGIMQYYYNAVDSVPKIFNKQNANNPVTGADSVHIVINENDFSFWLGEAKFYTSLNKAMESAINSIVSMLDRIKLEKEKTTIANLSSLKTNEKIAKHKEKIIEILSGNASIDCFRKKLHIPILLMCQDEILNQSNELDDQLKETLKRKYITDGVTFFEKLKTKFGSNLFLFKHVKFHLILFPVPNVDELNKFLTDCKKNNA